MINGAVEILGGVPGRHLHPLRLAESQASDAAGVIVISYAPAAECPGEARRFHDLFFFRGTDVACCARLFRDLRCLLPTEAALGTFESYRAHPSTRVSLYEAHERAVELLRSTCHLQPSLKLQMTALSLDQVRAQLLMSRCRSGIIEWSDVESEKPRLHLYEIRSRGDFSDYAPPHRGGRLLLYDSDGNREVLRHQAPAGAESPLPPPPAASVPEGEPVPAPRRPMKKPAERSEFVRAAERLSGSFRQKLHDALGRRAGPLLERAEEEIQCCFPEFDAHRLTDETAPLVPELLGAVVRSAPLLKRAKLRDAAALLLSDLYARHFDLLERHRAVDAVERAYHNLKR